jgi:hypothetical protein
MNFCNSATKKIFQSLIPFRMEKTHQNFLPKSKFPANIFDRGKKSVMGYGLWMG